MPPIGTVPASSQSKVVHPYITRTPGVQGGEACVVGTRVPVRVIAGCWKSGKDVVEIQQSYPHLTLPQILDAIGYCLDNPAEIDARNAAHEAAPSPAPNAWVLDDVSQRLKKL